MLLRSAAPADAEAIARVEVAAWRHAYEEIVGPERLEYLDVEEIAAGWRARLEAGSIDVPAVDEREPPAEDGPGPVAAIVAEQGGLVVAFAAVGRPATTVEAGSPATLAALYVHPVAQGAGVGTSLLARAEADLRATGAETAELRSFVANWWARRFFAARGWAHDEAAPANDDDPPTERWVRQLGEPVRD